jgi:hypothetical protein
VITRRSEAARSKQQQEETADQSRGQIKPNIGVRQIGMGPIQPPEWSPPRAVTANRTYPLRGTAEGLRLVEQGHARGKVVITRHKTGGRAWNQRTSSHVVSAAAS